MTTMLLVATALLSAPLADTTLAVRPGDRIEVSRFSGDLVVEGWDRDELRVSGEDSRRMTVRRNGSTLEVTPDSRRGRSSLDVIVRVPRGVPLEIGGVGFELTLSGIEAAVSVQNVSGDLYLEDVGGPLRLRSVEGEIVVRRAGGGVSASSQADDVTLIDVSGPIDVHSGDGDLILADVESDRVRAETQDGDVDFSGTIADGGDYRFFVHSGDATLAVSPDMNATVSVSTFDGDFESEFPIRVERFSTEGAFEFALGSGSARVEIEVFDGEIRLLQR